MTAQDTDKKQKLLQSISEKISEAPAQNAPATTLENLDQDSPALAAYMRNLRAISNKIDEAENSEVSAPKLQDQSPETLSMLKREAADHIALHIALEDHLMEQMMATQNTLKETIATYVDILTELDSLEEQSNEKGGPSCH